MHNPGHQHSTAAILRDPETVPQSLPSTNVVLVDFVVSTKIFFISQPIIIKLRLQTEDNILQSPRSHHVGFSS